MDDNLIWRIRFTNLKAVGGFCNNFQVWNECAMPKSGQRKCGYNHVCSNCADPAHGRGDCPSKPENESVYE